MNSEKTAVLLVNLGSPEAPTARALRPYLKEFLSDRRVVDVNPLLWAVILRCIIVPFRSPKSAERYASVWTDRGSPLAVYTQDLAEQLSVSLAQSGTPMRVAFAMRYGKPSQDEVFRSLHEREGYDRIIVIPLYPQYSATTTASVMDGLTESLRGMRSQPKLQFVRDYHDNPAYINAVADSIRNLWQQKGPLGRNDLLVLSFHGMPKRFCELGDPYEQQARRTADFIREELGVTEDQAPMVFQSRFGKEEWLQPYLSDALLQYAHRGVERVDVICPGFAADCLETLEEVGEEGRATFLEAGGKEFNFIPCLNATEGGVQIIKDLVLRHNHF